jgi:AraC-like DNA-binding protein
MDTNVLNNIIVKKINSVLNIHTKVNRLVRRKDRPYWAVIIKYEGETIYFNKGKQFVSNLENMIILPKGSCYDWQCIKEGRYFAVEFDCDLSCDDIFSFPISNSDKFLQLFNEINQAHTIKKPTYKMEIMKKLYSILLLLLQQKQPKYIPSYKQNKIAPSIEFILNNYNQKITNEMLADISGLSVVYFRKLFTETLGISPIAYVTNLRIKKAKEILSSDYDSLADVAVALGFADIYDFSRSFKKHTGLSPTNYIKSIK